ncbi:quinon protein alcohol dehydrogenase-like superfamily [Rhodocollybia butyracea]|uniref:Quinon protein alcohol dehydrogenase-like superfamily n=1 Tax=Rhodocollybia butyracea TaxID=206335 RepID=A0A9P5PN15_9AGAR|nr:quinon protein alcohol dehydrogenase-like superfamily [Rhodocollybia butyracea]
MATSFKYTFVKSTLVANRFPAGSIGCSLSFSADGRVLAVGKNTVPTSVSFLNVSDGSSAGEAKGYFSGLFLRSEADKIVLSRDSQFTEMFKRDSGGGSTWKLIGWTYGSSLPTSLDSGNNDNFFLARNESFNLFKGGSKQTYSSGSLSAFPTALACAPDGISLVLGYKDGSLQYLDYPSGEGTKQFLPVQFGGNGRHTTEITSCVWSHDGRSIASGDAAGVVCLWDATSKNSIQFLRKIEPAQTGRVNRLVFDPDNTVLIISNGSQLDVWDIGQEKHISVLGLPFTAQNIALDYARRRVAIAIGMDVFVYDMKAVQVGSSGGGDTPSNNVPSDLKDMDITSKVTKSQSRPFPGLFYDIHRGAFEVQYSKRLLHVVAIKSFRTGFNPQSSDEERKAFESVHLF